MRIPGYFEEPINEIKQKRITITTTETELVADTIPLQNRKKSIVVNDSSNIVYVSDKDTFDTTDSLSLVSGEVLSVSIDESCCKKYYAKLEEGTTTIRVYEIK